MNSFELQRWNNRTISLAAVVTITSFVVVVGNSPPWDIFMLLVGGAVGLGITWLVGGRPGVVMYLYGLSVPLFSSHQFGHDGELIMVGLLVLAIGSALAATTVGRFGEWRGSASGTCLGIVIASGVVLI